MTDSATQQGTRFLISVRARLPWWRRELMIDAHHLLERPACLRRADGTTVLTVNSVIDSHRDTSWALPNNVFLTLDNVDLTRNTPELLVRSRATLMMVQDTTRSWADKHIMHRGSTEMIVAFR